MPSGLCLFGILYFFLEVRPPAHCRASAHFFSEISRLMLARDLGRASSSHSTPLLLRGGPILRPIEVLPSQAVPRLDLIEAECVARPEDFPRSKPHPRGLLGLGGGQRGACNEPPLRGQPTGSGLYITSL